MKRLSLFILLFTFSTTLFAQQERTVRGVVTNMETGGVIENVHVSLVGVSKQTITDSEGEFLMKGSFPNNFELRFSHVSHRDTVVTYSFEEGQKSIEIRAQLMQMSYDVPVATVQQQKPDTVFGTDSLHVADFVFTTKGSLLLLTYSSQRYLKSSGEQELDIFEGCRLILIDSEGKLLSTYGISSLTTGLERDFQENCYLKCRDKLYKIEISESDEMDLQLFDQASYDEYIAPVVDSLGPYWFYSNWTEEFPAFDYFAVDMRDTSHHHLLNVEDELQMKMHRASYRDLKGRDKLKAFRSELETGIDKEIVGGFMAGQHQSIYHEETYAPLVVASDTVLIFDYCSGMLYKADKHLSLSDSTKINHHEKSAQNWKRDLLQDQTTQHLYAEEWRSSFHFQTRAPLS
jgi:hypothetical protein